MEPRHDFTDSQSQMQKNPIPCENQPDALNKQYPKQEIAQIQEPKYPQQTKSKFHQFYQSYIKHKNVDFQAISKQHLFAALQNTQIGVSLHPKVEFPQLIIFQNIQTFENIKIFTVKIGPFRQKIYVLLENRKSPFHNTTCYANGCFGTVYTVSNSQLETNQTFVIKCIKIHPKKPQILKFHIREYFFTNLFSHLNIGPKSIKKFGFDMILWQDCIEFTLEKCTQLKLPMKKNLDFPTDYFSVLAQKLYKMHQLNIVHLDIKPQNILFSQSHKEPVFIDFGCTKYIQQKIGQFSFSSFVGTYEYASIEMKRIFLCGKGPIDLYHNDMFSLKHSQEKLQLQGKIVEIGLSLTQRKQSFLYPAYLELKLVQFKHHLHMNQKDKLKQILDLIANSEEYMIQVLLYFSRLKSSYEMRECFEVIHPFISRLKKMYDDQSFKKFNILAESQGRFMNVYDLIDFLQHVFIKKIDNILDRIEQKEQKIPTEQSKYLQAFEGTCSTEIQPQNGQKTLSIHKHMSSQKQFYEFYESINQAQNIQRIKTILMSKDLISNLSAEQYFLMFLNYIDFTKNRGIHLQEKMNFARVFCEVCDKDLFDRFQRGNQAVSNQAQHRFDQLKRCMEIMLTYCTNNELTSFKLMLFSKIMAQTILIHSATPSFQLPDLNKFIKIWLQMLAKDKIYKLIQKYDEAYKMFQCQYIVELTELYIFSFEIVDQTVVKGFLKDMKDECYEWNEEDLVISQLYNWLIMSLYSIDAGTMKMKQMKKRLETNYQIQIPLRSYLLKMLDITTYSTEILLGHIRDIKKINHFEQILSNLHKQMKDSKYFTNFQQQAFIFKCKIFRFAIKKFHYQKSAILLKQIQDQISCEEITKRMFLFDKCYMMKQKSVVNLADLIRRVSKMGEEVLRKINYDFLNLVVQVLKHKVYNVFLQKRKAIPLKPFKEIEGQIIKLVRIKQKQFQDIYTQTQKVYYYWFETLYKLINTCEFNKRQCFQIYQSYYQTTIKHNKSHYYRLNYLYNKLKVQQFYVQNPKDMLQVMRMFEGDLMAQIQEILQDKEYHFLAWKDKQEYASGLRFLQLDEVLNLYFKAVISIADIPIVYQKNWKKKYQILLKLVKLSEQHHHYISFFQGYSLVFDVLMALTNNIFEQQNYLVADWDFNMLQKQSLQEWQPIFQSSSVREAKSFLWNFVFNLSINLTQLVDTDFQVEYIKQLEQFFLQIQTNFTKLPNKPLNLSDSNLIKHQIIDLAEFFHQKITQVQQIHMQKHNGLVVFQIFTCYLKKMITGMDLVKEKKVLWKLTKSMEFLRSFIKRLMLPKYFSLFHDHKYKNISFRKFLLMNVRNEKKQAAQQYWETKVMNKKSIKMHLNKTIDSKLKQKMKRFELNGN